MHGTLQKTHRLRLTRQLYIQLVFVTKGRNKTLADKRDQVWLGQALGNICALHSCHLLAFGAEADHVHLLVRLSANISIAKLANQLKGKSSYEFTRRPGRKPGEGLWSASYYANTVGSGKIEHSRSYIGAHQGRSMPQAGDVRSAAPTATEG